MPLSNSHWHQQHFTNYCLYFVWYVYLLRQWYPSISNETINNFCSIPFAVFTYVFIIFYVKRMTKIEGMKKKPHFANKSIKMNAYFALRWVTLHFGIIVTATAAIPLNIVNAMVFYFAVYRKIPLWNRIHSSHWNCQQSLANSPFINGFQSRCIPFRFLPFHFYVRCCYFILLFTSIHQITKNTHNNTISTMIVENMTTRIQSTVTCSMCPWKMYQHFRVMFFLFDHFCFLHL